MGSTGNVLHGTELCIYTAHEVESMSHVRERDQTPEVPSTRSCIYGGRGEARGRGHSLSRTEGHPQYGTLCEGTDLLPHG